MPLRLGVNKVRIGSFASTMFYPLNNSNMPLCLGVNKVRIGSLVSMAFSPLIIAEALGTSNNESRYGSRSAQTLVLAKVTDRAIG